MSNHGAVLLLILIAVLGVFLSPSLSARNRVPTAVGEMMFGAFVVATAPGLKHLPPFVDFIQLLGPLFVLLLAGLELNTRSILRSRPGRLLGVLPFGGCVPVSGMIGAVPLGQPPDLELIVGTVSIGLLPDPPRTEVVRV